MVKTVFVGVGLSFVLVSLHWLCPIYTSTQSNTIRSYESSFISWLSVLAIFLGGAGLSPSPCSCSLFFAAFCAILKKKELCKITFKCQRLDMINKGSRNNVSSAYLFVPLLMKVTQEDVGFLCYNNCRNKKTKSN